MAFFAICTCEEKASLRFDASPAPRNWSVREYRFDCGSARSAARFDSARPRRQLHVGYERNLDRRRIPDHFRQQPDLIVKYAVVRIPPLKPRGVRAPLLMTAPGFPSAASRVWIAIHHVDAEHDERIEV